jgi:membrane-bound ClpP family serine protease
MVAFALGDWLSQLSSTNQVAALLIILAATGVADAISAWEAERVRRKREAGIPAGLVKFIGASGVALTNCNPEGKIRIGYETWTAIALPSTYVKAGDKVIVNTVRKGKLIINLAEHPKDSGEAG